MFGILQKANYTLLFFQNRNIVCILQVCDISQIMQQVC